MLRWLTDKLWRSSEPTAGVGATSAALIDRSDLSELVRLIREIDIAEALPERADD